MQVTLCSCGPAVNESERKAFEHITTRLKSTPGDGTWVLLTNLAFSATHRLQSDEIDIVAIGPPGVRVIEVKHWTARWIAQNPALVEAEADRVTNKARKIGTTLRRKFSDLGHVDGTFLLTEESVKVKEAVDTVKRGVRIWSLKEWRAAIGFDSPSVLSRDRIAALANALTSKSRVAVDGSLRRLAGYVNLELQTPSDQQFHRMYKGMRSGTQDRVILHLYDRSVAGTNAEPKARREFDALHRLQLYDWAPRVLDSYQDAPGYAGEMCFFTVVDPAAPSLAERKSDDSWDATARCTFARNAVRALGELHGKGTDDQPLCHRNLTPRTILVRHDNAPIFTGFELSRIPADVSVASPGAPPGGWGDETAPEIRAQGLGAADRRSDVYALCACLTTLFPDRESETNRQILDLLAEGRRDAPEARIETEALETNLAALLGEAPPQPPPPPARFWTEGQVVRFRDRDYRIVSRLGSGGVGTTFKVVQINHTTGEDLGTYVAKIAHDEETGRRVLKTYEAVRSYLHHSALSTIFEVAPEWRDNDFLALMTWIDGSALQDFSGVFALLAEDLQEESGEALALRWLRSICRALDVLHRNGLVHGDVSPRNLLVSASELVLTDYDFAGKIGEVAAAPGTLFYCSPSRQENRPASASDDVYALAASFFHVLFEKEPFLHEGVRAKERGLNWEGADRAAYPTVATFLDKATRPDPMERYDSVANALRDLDLLHGAKIPASDAEPIGEADERVQPDSGSDTGVRTERSRNEVAWLRSLLQSYPGSSWGNRETRGLDTDFAAQTYVETNIEETLYRDVVNRTVRLVVLCGNAGDGKTALLQHLAERIGIGKHQSEERIIERRMDDGLTVRMNLDGSASWRGRSADDLLDEFLEPFQNGPPSADIVHLLAINDGRLLEWLEGVVQRRGRDTQLTTALYDLLDGQASVPGSHIRFVSLNQRSLVGGVSADGQRIETGFLHRLLDKLYGGDRTAEIWEPCRTCVAEERCEVRRAARLFGPDGLPGRAPEERRSRARQRLFEALQAVHLRGETHITVRELRAAVVYVLFGVHFCQEYHAGADTPLPYWDRAFSPESPGRQGEVLRELVRFDPALEAHPQIDRHLQREPSMDTAGSIPRYPRSTREQARRRAYFEWTESDSKELTGDPQALDLARGRHLRAFRSLPIDEEAPDELRNRLCKGISRLEDVPPQALERAGVVPLRITPRTPTETEFWIEKKIDAFRLVADLPPETAGLDRLHRQASLLYSYRDGREERLRLGAELFHLLLELAEGYQLGDVSTDDTFAHLSIFVQRLIREDDRRVLARNPMQDEALYEVSAKIVEDAEGGRQQKITIHPLQQGGGK